jgi:hypothetical protein
MTQSEALKWLGSDDLEEAFDLFEERLFEAKQFFLNKPTVSKLFHAQLKKVNFLSRVANALGVQEKDSELRVESIDFFENIADSFSLFERRRSEFRLSVSRAVSPKELEKAVLHFLEIQRVYMAKWPIFSGDNNVVISKEPDPMELLNALKAANVRDIVEFSDLNSKRDEIPEALLNEWKRLSLLRSKELEWQTSLKS